MQRHFVPEPSSVNLQARRRCSSSNLVERRRQSTLSSLSNAFYLLFYETIEMLDNSQVSPLRYIETLELVVVPISVKF